VSNYKIHAMNEFRACGWLKEDGSFDDEFQGAICEHVLALLDVFAEEGHSGSSAPYAVNMFKKLALFEPIAELTGEDWEWEEVGDDGDLGGRLYQNKRCSHVFKNDNGAYDINGIIFWETCERDLYDDEEGYPGKTEYKSYFSSSESRVVVEFPYSPKTEYKEYKR